MNDSRTTRRSFLATTAAVLALGVLVGCGGGAGGGGQGGSTVIFALSGRGRRISNAARKHNANKRFLTFAVADRNRAHPGDRSRVVTLVVSKDEFKRLFGFGQDMVDLRHA